jgi:hypothetical protein
MRLSQLIQKCTDWQTKTAEEISAELRDPVHPKADRIPWNYDGLAAIIGAENMEAFLPFAVELLKTSGNPLAFAVANEASRNVSLLEYHGLEATDEEIAAELAAMKLQLDQTAKKGAASVRYAVYCHKIDTEYDGTPGTEPKL